MKFFYRHQIVAVYAIVMVRHYYKNSVLPVGAGFGLFNKFAVGIVRIFNSIIDGIFGLFMQFNSSVRKFKRFMI